MRPSPALITAVAAAVSFILLAAAPLPGGTVTVLQGDARNLTAAAVELIEEGRQAEALRLLDRAVADDDEHWEAHYQRGRALGQLGRWSAARDALVRATELHPGHGHAHRLAALAAIQVEDWEVAWEQSIRAQLAGQDMGQTMLQMYSLSPPPEDFATRINAATVFVADVDTAPATEEIELPTNFNPNAPSSGQRRGRPADLEDSAVSQASLDLIRLQRAMRRALAESPRLGVVIEPGRAQYILSIQLTDISTTRPPEARGYFRLIDVNAREIVYRQPIDLDNFGSLADTVGKLRRYVTDLTAWLEERQRIP